MKQLQFYAPQALLLIAVVLLGLMATPGGAQGQAIPIEYNAVYICGGEQVIVTRCASYCAVIYPDRPRRNDIQYETVEERGSVVEKIQSCQLQRAGQPANAQAAPRTPAAAAAPAAAQGDKQYDQYGGYCDPETGYYHDKFGGHYEPGGYEYANGDFKSAVAGFMYDSESGRLLYNGQPFLTTPGTPEEEKETARNLAATNADLAARLAGQDPVAALEKFRLPLCRAAGPGS